MKSQETLWLYIHPYVYVAYELEPSACLLYHTQSGARVETNQEAAIDMVKQMHQKTSLGTFLLQPHQVSQDTRAFIEECVQKSIFGTEAYVEGRRRPIQLMPVLNIQKDVDRLNGTKDRSIGENVLNYLRYLTLYIADDCQQNCSYCKSACLQVNYCKANSSNSLMSLEMLELLVQQVKYAPLDQIDIMGGDIFRHPHLARFASMLELSGAVAHFWSHYRNFRANDFKVNFDICVDAPVDMEVLQQCIALVGDRPVQFHFLVESDLGLEHVDQVIIALDLKHTTIEPFYTGHNLDFFKEQVFLNRDDIFVSPIAQRQIFCNQALNTHDFGRFIVFSDGEVRANMNTPVLGRISDDSLLELIYKELDTNTAWRKTRIQTPCSDCLYQYLCPPISNYESAIGQTNLCSVNKPNQQ